MAKRQQGIEEVKGALADAWVAEMVGGVTAARKAHWNGWACGYLYALFINGLIDLEVERQALDFVSRKLGR